MATACGGRAAPRKSWPTQERDGSAPDRRIKTSRHCAIMKRSPRRAALRRWLLLLIRNCDGGPWVHRRRRPQRVHAAAVRPVVDGGAQGHGAHAGGAEPAAAGAQRRPPRGAGPAERGAEPGAQPAPGAHRRRPPGRHVLARRRAERGGPRGRGGGVGRPAAAAAAARGRRARGRGGPRRVAGEARRRAEPDGVLGVAALLQPAQPRPAPRRRRRGVARRTARSASYSPVDVHAGSRTRTAASSEWPSTSTACR